MAKINGQGASDIYENLIEYVSGCTRGQLAELEMRRLDEAAHLQQQLKVLINEFVRVSSEALLARALRQNRKAKAKALPESTSTAHELMADVFAVLPEVKAQRLVALKKQWDRELLEEEAHAKPKKS